jgi:hypothetical protein
LHPGAPAQRYRTRLAGDAEERLCDDIAAAILLPRLWVSTTFRTERHCLATIRRLSGTTNTSMSASLVRLAEVLGWPESLLRFRFVDLRWRLDAPAAVPFQVHGQLRTTPETSEALDAVGKRTRRDTEAIVPLRIAGRNWRVRAEVSVARTVAVALLNLRPEPGLAEPD